MATEKYCWVGVDLDAQCKLAALLYKFCLCTVEGDEMIDIIETRIHQFFRIPNHTIEGTPAEGDPLIKVVPSEKEILDEFITFVHSKGCKIIDSDAPYITRDALVRACLRHNRTLNIDLIASDEVTLKWPVNCKPNQ